MYVKATGRPFFLMLDFETRSELSLSDCSSTTYAKHPSTDVLCLGIQLGGDTAARVIVPASGPVLQSGQCPVPQEILEALRLALPVYAHNVSFDRRVYQHQCVDKLGWPRIPDGQWRDLLAVASYYTLPRGLAKLAEALKLQSQKDKAGGKVMSTCSRPRKPRKSELKEWEASNPGCGVMPTLWHEDPEKLQIVYEYCRVDVETQTEALMKLGPLPPQRQRDWMLDQMINQRGIGVDWAAAVEADKRVQASLQGYNERLQQLTSTAMGVAVHSVNQRDRILDWLSLKGVDTVSLDKASVDNLLKLSTLPDDAREVLTIRKEAGKSSLAKLQTLLELTDDDWRLRDTLLWHGASTGRWTGKGFQPHNLPRDCYDQEQIANFVTELRLGLPFSAEHSVPDVIVKAIRGMLVPAEGNKLFVSDFAAIECRVLAWMCGCEPQLAEFRAKRCVYRAFASLATGIPKEQIEKKSRERLLGKVAILGLGYGMGGKAKTHKDNQGRVVHYEPSKFQIMAKQQGDLDVPDEMSESLVKLYRTTYPEVPAMWRSLEQAFIRAIETRSRVQCGRLICSSSGQWASIELPSGRLIWYAEPSVYEELRTVSTSRGPRKVMSKTAMFWGVNPINNQWQEQHTWGGTLTENVVQATAADLLTEAMHRLEAAGFPVVLSVHDEVVCEVGPDQSFEQFHAIMEETPSWAAGCPLECESAKMARYGK